MSHHRCLKAMAIAACVAITCGIGCGKPPAKQTPVNQTKSPPGSAIGRPTEDTSSTQPQDSDEAAPEEAMENVIDGNNAFALALYRQLASGDSSANVFVSPYSVSAALAMTYAGAEGATAEEMRKTLRFPNEETTLHLGFERLEEALAEVGAGEGAVALSTGNRIWVDQGFDLLPAFTDLLSEHYGSGVGEVSFTGAHEAARRTINEWIAEQTRRKIEELLKEGDVTPQTALVLTNAIHFKGDWLTQFDPEETSEQAFHAADGTTVQVAMMSLKSDFAHAQRDGVQVLELPYAGERLAMTLIVPMERDGLAAIEKELTVERLESWLAGLRERETQLFLPKFSSRYRTELQPVLSSMGMPIAFGGSADFSGMTGRRNLFISKVIHEAVIDVYEEGTEAAAATGVVMKRTAMGPVVRCDRPFLYFIRDREAGAILFMGRLAKPDEA